MPILSICIPTFKRIELTRQTIQSIYDDISGVDLADFEVVISDNDLECSSQVFEDEFKYDNFHYFPTNCEGFLNSFYVLSYGKGTFLKLQNNVDLFRKGTLSYLINQVKSLSEEKPIIYHTNGMLGKHDFQRFDSTDDFFKRLNYFCSWSAGFGIWKDDYDRIKNSIKIDKWFPQTSLLLDACLTKKSFIIDDTKLRNSLHIHKKGGYNTYEVFGVSFLDLMKEAEDRGIISSNTFETIKKSLFRRYLASRYLKTVILKRDSFDHSNIQEHLSKYYGKSAYIKLVVDAFLYPLRFVIG